MRRMDSYWKSNSKYIKRISNYHHFALTDDAPIEYKLSYINYLRQEELFLRYIDFPKPKAKYIGNNPDSLLVFGKTYKCFGIDGDNYTILNKHNFEIENHPQSDFVILGNRMIANPHVIDLWKYPLWLEYAILHPQPWEEGFDGIHFGGIKGIRDDAPNEAKLEFLEYLHVVRNNFFEVRYKGKVDATTKLTRKKIYKCVGITFPKKWLLVINDLGKEQYYDIMDFVILDSLR